MMVKIPQQDTQYPSLGYFLRDNDWENANNLLGGQLAIPRFNNLNMRYYRHLDDSNRKRIKALDYFHTYVKSNLFYGLSKEFQTVDYIVPKLGLAVRNSKFFSYPMHILYYAIGSYLLRLSYDLIEDFNSREIDNSQINCFYGGSLTLDRENKINSFDESHLHYKQSYRQYKELITECSKTYDVILKIDIQNYFDEISIPILLENIEKNVKYNTRSSFKYNEVTKEQIIQFFNYLMKSPKGVPQSEGNIISGFIGFLYTLFICMSIELLLNENKKITSFKIISYVDDISIFLSFESSYKKQHAINIGQEIADMLFSAYKVRLNDKTKIFELFKKADLEEFEKQIKKISIDDVAPDDLLNETEDEDISKKPQENQKVVIEAKFNKIVEAIQKLKETGINPIFSFNLEDEKEILKDAYDKKMNQFFSKKENIAKLESLFSDFDFNLVAFNPKPLIIIICKTNEAKKKYEEFLLNTSNTTTQFTQFIVTYLLQINYFEKRNNPSSQEKNSSEQDILFTKLAQNLFYVDIVKLLNMVDINFDDNGYHEIPTNLLTHLQKCPSVIEQIQHRRISERMETYSLALNHLLNEIHALCNEIDRDIDGNYQKDYDSNITLAYLEKIRIPTSIRIQISNLFHRRNLNLISHPTTAGRIASSVTKTEYEHYKKYVGLCIKKILESIPKPITSQPSQPLASFPYYLRRHPKYRLQ